MAIITITRGLHSGGEEIAEHIAKKIGARCVSGELLAETSSKYNLPEEKMQDFFESSPTFWEKLTESRLNHLFYIKACLAEMAQDNNLVYHGHGGHELLRDVPHVLRVRLTYPIPYRVKRIIGKFNYSEEKATRFVEHIDQERTERTRYLFNADWRDPTRYDVVLRLEKISRETCQSIISAMLDDPAFHLSEDKKLRFHDFLIKTKVNMFIAGLLGGHVGLVVNVQDGVVSLRGSINAPENQMQDLEGKIKTIPGVKQFENHIQPNIFYQEWAV